MVENHKDPILQMQSNFFNQLYVSGRHAIKNASEAALTFALVVGEMNANVYCLPTYYRRRTEPSEAKYDLKSTGAFYGWLTGSIAGILVLGYQFLLYSSAVRQGHPEILLFPTATNAVSLLYEVGRKAVKSTNEQKSNDLEERVSK